MSRPVAFARLGATGLELVEATRLVTREQPRSAVGQLLDYGRFVEAKTRTVLVLTRPRPDLLDLSRPRWRQRRFRRRRSERFRARRCRSKERTRGLRATRL